MLKLQSQPIKQQTINFLGWAVGRLDGWTVGRLGGWAVRQSHNNLFTYSQLNYCEITVKLITN